MKSICDACLKSASLRPALDNPPDHLIACDAVKYGVGRDTPVAVRRNCLECSSIWQVDADGWAIRD